MQSRLARSAHADRNRFLSLYAVMAIGLIVAAALFVFEARKIVEDGLRDEDAFAVLGAANRVLHDLENAETGQRGYLLTGDERYLGTYRAGVEDLDDTVLQLQRVVTNDEKSVELVRRIEHAKTMKVTELARTVELAQSGNREAAIALVQTNEGKRYMDSLRADLGALLHDWRARRAAAVRDAHDRIVWGTAALAALAVLICGLLVYTLFVQRRAFGKMSAHSKALDKAAAHDPLTGLPNRRRLLELLDEQGERSAAPGAERLALLYLDIDGFKGVNDALGHSAGDSLLRRIAEALRTVTRQQDLLARVGGDEFVLLVPGYSDEAQLRELAGRLIERVQQIGQRDYGGRFPLGVSVGIATWPDRVDAVEQLLDVADAAMYTAKQAGRSTYRFGTRPGRQQGNVVTLPR
ncbi:GGDEF domain-containing protein [Paraburkholderia rhizosphaerae]|uniref:Diguanylate cyclase (GGDEF)-like protein n=1 Tax=Paraburkholderia rhizosphaerae TaxID=480658 RepID=A0A4R8LID5_9BURK|nr:diguanylate cyclase [Paraburkholderia rhizosphaerae]TDY42980.1 diguanylate cyclase (GGDEF)-like protein [Paraburkholderia rhizosphaerae]